MASCLSLPAPWFSGVFGRAAAPDPYDAVGKLHPRGLKLMFTGTASGIPFPTGTGAMTGLFPTGTGISTGLPYPTATGVFQRSEYMAQRISMTKY